MVIGVLKSISSIARPGCVFSEAVFVSKQAIQWE